MTEINPLPQTAHGFTLQPFDDPAAFAHALGRQQPSATDQGQRTKGKHAQRKRGRGNSNQQEAIGLNATQAAHVKIVKVDAKRDGFAEERAATAITLSKVGRAPQLQLSDDRLSVTGSKGFRTVRATHGTHNGGAWYCEVTIKHLGATGHGRLGWCTSRAEFQAPVGFDAYGFCLRDVDGSKVTEGRREPYGEGFKEGDVVGLLIHLPDGGRPFESLDRSIGRYKGQLYLVQEVSTDPQPLKGSLIAFTVNGKYQGVAFKDILEGTYYPAASLYTMPEQAEGATVTFNFGPDFKHPPPEIPDCSPAQPCSLLPSIIHAALAQQEEENNAPLSNLPFYAVGVDALAQAGGPGGADVKQEDQNGGGSLPLPVDQILASIPSGVPLALPERMPSAQGGVQGQAATAEAHVLQPAAMAMQNGALGAGQVLLIQQLPAVVIEQAQAMDRT